MKIVTHEHKDAQTVFVEIQFKAGAKYSSRGKEGIAHFTEHVVMNGSPKYPSGLKVREAVEQLGGRINGRTGSETVSYWIKLSADDLEKGLDILFSITSSPLLNEKEAKGERKIILEEIARMHDAPMRRVVNALFGTIYKDHTLGLPVIGHVRTIKEVGVSDIKKFFNAYYTPPNAIVSVAGRISHEEIVRLTQNYFGNQKKNSPPSYTPFQLQQTGPQVTVLKEKTKQSRMALGFTGKPITIRDYAVTSFLTSLLHSSGRLFRRLREEEQLSYDIGASAVTITDLPFLMIHGGFTYRKVKRALLVICEELQKVKETAVSKEEFAKLKKSKETGLLFALENPEGWVDFALDWNQLIGEVITPQRWLEEVRRVTLGDVQKLAQGTFVPQNAFLAASHHEIKPAELKEILQEGLS